MSPRAYRMQQRRAGMDATRARIIAAARRALTSGDAVALDAIARDAGVARLTIYDRFGTREALFEAVLDDLAETGGLIGLPDAFMEPDPVIALERFVTIFCAFYSTHRVTLRRLNALTVLGQGASGQPDRNARRLRGLDVLLTRVAGSGHAGAAGADVIHAAHVLTGFSFVDEFAGPDQDPIDAAAQIVALVKAVAHLA
jgi:AcrR family transcriptional regulator